MHFDRFLLLRMLAANLVCFTITFTSVAHRLSAVVRYFTLHVAHELDKIEFSQQSQCLDKYYSVYMLL